MVSLQLRVLTFQELACCRISCHVVSVFQFLFLSNAKNVSSTSQFNINMKNVLSQSYSKHDSENEMNVLSSSHFECKLCNNTKLLLLLLLLFFKNQAQKL